MINSKLTKIFLILTISSSSVLLAFPEPVDIHVDVERIIEDAQERSEGAQKDADCKRDGV